jgi:hypothetical protein
MFSRRPHRCPHWNSNHRVLRFSEQLPPPRRHQLRDNHDVCGIISFVNGLGHQLGRGIRSRGWRGPQVVAPLALVSIVPIPPPALALPKIVRRLLSPTLDPGK